MSSVQTSGIGVQRASCTQPGSVLPVSSHICSAEKQLEELAVEEAEVLKILTQVNVVRRECEIVSVATRLWSGAPCPVALP